MCFLKNLIALNITTCLQHLLSCLKQICASHFAFLLAFKLSPSCHLLSHSALVQIRPLYAPIFGHLKAHCLLLTQRDRGPWKSHRLWKSHLPPNGWWLYRRAGDSIMRLKSRIVYIRTYGANKPANLLRELLGSPLVLTSAVWNIKGSGSQNVVRVSTALVCILSRLHSFLRPGKDCFQLWLRPGSPKFKGAFSQVVELN